MKFFLPLPQKYFNLFWVNLVERNKLAIAVILSYSLTLIT